MIDLKSAPPIASLAPKLRRLWEVSATKLRAIEARYNPTGGAPVFTVAGRYTTRGWTDWTQGFQYGSALLQFDATGDPAFLEIGRRHTVSDMAGHVTHFGVHDHGFNNVSTYGNLLRLLHEGRVDAAPWEQAFYELALKASGAVQAHRWTPLRDGGYLYSFNGPHSLFADTMRTLRVLAVAHRLGQRLHGENDVRVSLLERLVQHARTTARYTVYYGRGRDGYDVRGRVAHESLFNTNDGCYRCPSTQQGYSPFSTWTRGLAWVLLGFAEQLEFVASLPDDSLVSCGGRTDVEVMMKDAAQAAADFYLENTPSCGVPYWDTGAPRLHKLGAYLDRPADPYNDWEPVDSSAGVIAAQGLLRLGRYVTSQGGDGHRYQHAGLKALDTLFDAPYLCADPEHEGLLLHSIYHWPNRWDHVPAGAKVARGEATMWGDYHAREVALYVQRLINDEPYYAFVPGLVDGRGL
jgi:unsaturated chondroitin disaccharide hydrolase